MNNKAKDNDALEASIHSISHDGRGMTTFQNKTTFVENALPNERVTYQILRKHGRYNEAKVIDIVQASPNRITPACPHFNLCGGCNLQHLSTAGQLAYKQQAVLDQLKHIGKVIPDEILPPLSALTSGYRRKARLGVKFVTKKNKLLVGFREKSGRYLADLEQCTILYPKIGLHLQELSQLIRSLEMYQSIPQVEVSVGDTDAALIFRHLVPISLSDKEKLIIFGQKHHFHIYLQPHSPHSIEKIWPEDNRQELIYSLPDHQINFSFHPLDFTQINLEANRLMVNQAISLLKLSPHDSVLDLFCGIGNFTLPIARYAHDVTGIEGSDWMIERAKKNAHDNHISNVNFYAANLEKPILSSGWLNKHYDKILLDPPRIGAKEIVMFCKQFSANRIVYISCHSATLARDAEILCHHLGYQLKQIGIIDMFPHTSHIETIALFIKG